MDNKVIVNIDENDPRTIKIVKEQPQVFIKLLREHMSKEERPVTVRPFVENEDN